ncbi:ABC transporter permease [Anaerotalea alkaliphila]|uniref:ABC transporter permease n=1 Tax=Anaerotalea alkaliphila TaxID=2662126 RepID=A0A7X5HUD6_9FIRM|nr:ABC transporter permease [Anaerotalea alkaliphila]NDL66817.1 ABC transporter permease [Anaerotalea alkaliphila]
MGAPSLKARLGFALVAWALVGLPMGTFRPNRVVRGTPLGWDLVLGEYAFVLGGGLLLLMGAYAFLGVRKRFRVLGAVPWLLPLVPALLLVRLSAAVPLGMEADPAVLRVSLGAGFWVFLAGVLLVQSAGRRGGWAAGLTGCGLLVVAVLGQVPHLALYREFMNVRANFAMELRRHLVLALVSVLVAVVPGIAIGYWCYRYERAKEWLLGAVNLFQVIPTLSLLGLVMIPLTILARNVPLAAELGIKGIGFAPAFLVLTLYCLLPITANAYAGFEQVEEAVVDSAAAMGMTPRQIFRSVLFPLALPVIYSGIRTAVTQNIGNTILAGLIGGGGMGALIFLGLSQSASDLVVLGTIPVVAMALAADGLLKLGEGYWTRKVGVVDDPVETGQ